MLEGLLGEREFRVVMDELAELHQIRSDRDGQARADRWYRRQLRHYPVRLAWSSFARRLASARRALPLRGVGYAARGLMRAPALTAAVVLTVGVAVGGCTAIFAVVHTLFIRPLPYPDAERLVWIYTDSPPNRWPFSVADFQALADQQTSFEAVAAYGRNVLTLTADDVAERMSVGAVTPAFFDVLGVDFLAGQPASDGDAVPGAEPTMVVTPGFAARYLSGDGGASGDAVGQRVTLDGIEHRVVGVVPDDFGPLGRAHQAFTTLQLEPPGRKGPFFLEILARIRPEVGAARAREELRAINQRLFPLWADSYQDETASWGMLGLDQRLQGDSSRLLVALMSSVGLLLLIATANAANLLLARVGSRRRELAVRAAIGATPGHLVGLVLAESAILALGGVAVGLLVAYGIMAALPVVASAYLPRLQEVGLTGPVLAFALAVSFASAALFGVISALRGRVADVGSALRDGGRSATHGRGDQALQRVLVVGQLAVAVPLLAGAGLLVSSFVNLQRVQPGFDVEGLVSLRVPLARGTYPDAASRQQFWDETAERLSALPGVAGVGLASGRPPNEVSTINNFDLEDHPTPPDAAQPAVPWLSVDNGYFETLGIPLLQGRVFEGSEPEGGPPVVVVDQAWADRFFPGESVVGRRLVSGGCTSCAPTTVIGVVGSVPYLGVRRAHEGAVYDPYARAGLADPVLHIRTVGDPLDVIPMVRAQLRSRDPGIPLASVKTGRALLDDALVQPRHLSLIVTAFSVVALILAVVGIYGIMANSVQDRRGDIAVRLALGGSPTTVLRSVVRYGMLLSVVGLAAGVGAALVFTSLLSDLLFEVEANDPLLLGQVSLVLVTVSLLACALPAGRAVRVDPVRALREE